MSGGLSSSAARAASGVRRAFNSARPFKSAVIEDFLDPALCRALRADLAKDTRAAFREGRDSLGFPAISRTPRELGPGFARLEALLASASFLKWLQDATGVKDLRRNEEVSCGGLFRYDHDMELDIHLDSNDVDAHCAQTGHLRKINMLIYLSHGWKEEWGGHLEIYRDPSRPAVESFAPLFNRCVFFDNNEISWHAVTRVSLPEDERRRCRARFVMIANYYSLDKSGARPGPPHYNIWMPRPLPAHLRPGYRTTLADSLEVSRLLTRRDARLEELRRLAAEARTLKRRTRRKEPSARPEPFSVLKNLPASLLPGRVLTRRDLQALRREFAAKDRELRARYARQFAQIRRLKARAPGLVPIGY